MQKKLDLKDYSKRPQITSNRFCDDLSTKGTM